jgi:hypothetical protein
LSALYGESQPNTNGFKGGGKKIDISGKYTINYGTRANSNGTISINCKAAAVSTFANFHG